MGTTFGAVSRQHHGREGLEFFTNIDWNLDLQSSPLIQFSHLMLYLSTDCTLSRSMTQYPHTIDGGFPVKAATESMTELTPSSFKYSAPTDNNIVRFDPQRCPWLALRDVIYAKQNTNMKQLDICKALKVLYPDELQFQNMSSWDVEEMAQWWKDPAYPYRHRPLFCGSKSYENIGLRLKHALGPPKTAEPLEGAPVKPMRTTSSHDELANSPLPPRHPPPDSIFTTEGSQELDKPETRRSDSPEAAELRAVRKARKVKTNNDIKKEATHQQALTHPSDTDRLQIPSNCRSARPLLQNAKSATYCGEHSSNPTNDHGSSAQSLAEVDLILELGSLPPHLLVPESSSASTLHSKAQSRQKPIKQSLVLPPPPPQLIETHSVQHSELDAQYNSNIRLESGYNPSPTYGNHSTPPRSLSRFPSSSHPPKRQALGEKRANVWPRNGAGYEQLPSINSLFPSEHWENLCLKTQNTDSCCIAGQDKNQVIAPDQGAYRLNVYGRQDQLFPLPRLELSTSVPSLSSSSAVNPTNPIAGVSRRIHPSTPSLHPDTHPDLVVRKSYSEGRLKLPLVNHSGAGLRKRCSEGSLKFHPAGCPWHAIRDVALARDTMNLTNEHVALLIGHRYGNDYPSLKQVTVDQVQELWKSSRTFREALYTEQDCGLVEQELWNDLRTLGLI